jgi:hypothetical protein
MQASSLKKARARRRGEMRRKEIWLFIALASLFLFNWPFLEMFRQSVVAYLFGVWALFIILAGVLAGRDEDADRK